MKKILLGLVIFISPIFLLAHNPLSAFYRLKTNSDGGVLNIYLTQAGFNKALIDIHGADFMNSISQKRFKELMVSYIKDNFDLKVNNTKIELEKGGIRYGDHQTDLTFITSVFPKKIDKVDLKITTFKNNEHHQNVFYYTRNGSIEKIILNSKNKFEAKVNFDTNEEYNYLKIALSIIVVLFALIIIDIGITRKSFTYLRR